MQTQYLFFVVASLYCDKKDVNWHYSVVASRYKWRNVPKDSKSFVSDNYGANHLFSVTEVFVIDSWLPAAIEFSYEIFWDTATRRYA
jgi:hypothetical protein